MLTIIPMCESVAKCGEELKYLSDSVRCRGTPGQLCGCWRRDVVFCEKRPGMAKDGGIDGGGPGQQVGNFQAQLNSNKLGDAPRQ